MKNIHSEKNKYNGIIFSSLFDNCFVVVYVYFTIIFKFTYFKMVRPQFFQVLR